MRAILCRLGFRRLADFASLSGRLDRTHHWEVYRLPSLTSVTQKHPAVVTSYSTKHSLNRKFIFHLLLFAARLKISRTPAYNSNLRNLVGVCVRRINLN